MPSFLEELNVEDQFIVKSVVSALQKFRDHDYNLVARRTKEEALSHRLACYLYEKFKDRFSDCDVDCEYDKFGDSSKILGKKGIRPDILLHKRGSPDRNLLVIEVKKKRNPSKWDQRKLKGLTRAIGRYRYRLGLFVGFFSTEEMPITIWFMNGKVCE